MLEATGYIKKEKKGSINEFCNSYVNNIRGCAVWLLLTIMGLYMCVDNNAIGIVLLFITLNLIGLLLGIAIIYNKKQIKDNNE